MADSQELVAFSVKLAPSLAALESGNVDIFQLQCEKDKVVKIGRGGKSDIAINCPGISWTHAELKLLPLDAEAEGGRLQIGLRDVSSNGTGLQLPGGSVERLPKGQDTPLVDGALIYLPMRLKVAEDQRFLSVHLDGSANAAEARSIERVESKGGADDEERKEAEASKSVVENDSPIAEIKTLPATNNDSRPVRKDDGVDEEPARKRHRSEPSPEPAPAKLPVDDEPREKDLKSISEPNDSTLSRPPSAAPGSRPPPRGARPKASAAAAREKAFSDVPADLRDKITTGEGIIREAKEAEERNQWGQAFDCYERGLAYFMEVLPKLGKDSLGGASLRKQINGYLKKASELKEKLERSKAFGCRNLARPPRA